MKQDQTVRVPWASWFGDYEIDLSFPAGWSLQVCNPPGGPDVGLEGIKAAFASPIGTPRISEMARRKRSVAIVVDDLSRPTPASRILPVLLEELAEAGISRDDVLIIMGVACHRQLMREDMEKKLGPEILRTMHVKNHFAWDHLKFLGTTSYGTPVHVNTDFLAADLKIVLGGILPHGGPGFGGGAKLVLPGVTGIQTTYHNHRPTEQGGPGKGLNRVDDNESRLDIEETARMAGLNAIVNAVVNSKREIAALFVGDMVAAHRAGVAFARKALTTPAPVNADVVVLNSYPKDTEFVQFGLAFNPWVSASKPLVHERGTIVVTTASSEGPGFHSLHGPDGYLPNIRSPRANFGDRRMIILSPNVNRLDLSDEAKADAGLSLCSTWAEARALLERYHGASANVSVFPVAAMQLGAN
jgi:lactate racemase